MTEKFTELVEKTPTERTRPTKPKLEDFANYSEEGDKKVRSDEFKQSLADWADLEHDFINDPQYIADKVTTLKSLNRALYDLHSSDPDNEPEPLITESGKIIILNNVTYID